MEKPKETCIWKQDRSQHFKVRTGCGEEIDVTYDGMPDEPHTTCGPKFCSDCGGWIIVNGEWPDYAKYLDDTF